MGHRMIVRGRGSKMDYPAPYWPSGPISSQAGNGWHSFVLIIIVTVIMHRQTHTRRLLSPPWNILISYAGRQPVCVCVCSTHSLIRRLPALSVWWYSISLLLQYGESEWKSIHWFVDASQKDRLLYTQHRRLDKCWHMRLVSLEALLLSSCWNSFFLHRYKLDRYMEHIQAFYCSQIWHTSDRVEMQWWVSDITLVVVDILGFSEQFLLVLVLLQMFFKNLKNDVKYTSDKCR